MKITTVEEMRRMDRRAAEEHGVPELVLMENAGLAAARVARDEMGGRRVALFCGPGNNGGDGFVVARRLLSDGWAVEALLLAGRDAYRGAAATNLAAAEGVGVPLVDDPDDDAVAAALGGCDLVVDAILGTGVSRDVEGRFAEIIGRINDAGPPVLALDIPSGIDGDTGQIRGTAVQATATVTFGLPKRGNLLYPGAARGGRLFVCHISFPPGLTGDDAVQVELGLPAALPPRRPDGHKGSFGDALFVAGAAGYYGAPAFAALSHLRAGGGYARLAAPRSICAALSARAGEVVYHPQQETADGGLALAALDELEERAAAADFVVLGPGVGLAGETQELVRRLARAADAPLLVDGDGLTAAATDLDCLRRRAAATVLTPHPGEMARLTGRTVGEILADPVAAAQEAAADLSAIVVLKGAHTVVARPDGRVTINPSGNPGMATAGSGDVLTGAVSAMAGLGLELPAAVVTGVFLHGLAGDLAAAEMGEDGMTAPDVLRQLPAAVRRLREERDEIVRGCYGLVTVV